MHLYIEKDGPQYDRKTISLHMCCSNAYIWSCSRSSSRKTKAKMRWFNLPELNKDLLAIIRIHTFSIATDKLVDGKLNKFRVDLVESYLVEPLTVYIVLRVCSAGHCIIQLISLTSKIYMLVSSKFSKNATRLNMAAFLCLSRMKYVIMLNPIQTLD